MLSFEVMLRSPPEPHLMLHQKSCSSICAAVRGCSVNGLRCRVVILCTGSGRERNPLPRRPSLSVTSRRFLVGMGLRSEQQI